MNDPRAPGLAASADDVAAHVAATIRPEIRALAAYPVAKAEGMIKLDAMENPYSLPADVRTRLANALSEIAINRYPDGGADVVKAALRASLALPDDVALMVGNGSDELLQIITTAVTKPGAAIVAPDPSFVMYRLYAVYANARYVTVPLREDFSLDADAMLASIERERPALVWLAYPNNPTGNLFDAGAVEAIIRAERTRLATALATIPGVTVYPTATNFVLARVPSASGWFTRLRDANILVKNLHGWHPLLANCLRITVGTPAENDALLRVLKPMP